jgi:hypothetical protein
VVANLIAMLFQALAVRLGNAIDRNLAGLCRERFPKFLILLPWVINTLTVPQLLQMCGINIHSMKSLLTCRLWNAGICGRSRGPIE